MDATVIICNCPKCEKKREEEMSKRYIVVEQEDPVKQQTFYMVYEKGWFFNTLLRGFLDRQSAVNLILRLIKEGDKPKKRIVFDSKKDLSFDIHF